VGKKPQGPYAGKSVVFSTRITPDLRARLGAAAAAKKGYSLSQEIEERLRDSFILEQKISDSFGSEQNYLIMRIVALVMQSLRSKDWMTDPGSFELVLRTIVNVLEQIRPSPPLTEAERGPMQRALDDYSSKQISAALWTSIQEADVAAPISKGSRKDHLLGLLKRRLGPIANRPRPNFLTMDDLSKMLHEQIDMTPGDDLRKKGADHSAVNEVFQPELEPKNPPTSKRRKAKK
jgi:hypothetical protein